MPRLTPAAVAALCILQAGSAAAQESPRWFGQVTFGPASRTASGPNGGFHIDSRGGILVTRHLGLVAGLSVARFSDETAVVSYLCPQNSPCLPARFQDRGLGVAGLSVGLQPRVKAGPLEFAFTGTAGGYWLYHRDSGLPALTTGIEGGVSLGLPIASRFRVLLEGTATHMLRHSAGDASTRRLGIGIGFH